MRLEVIACVFNRPLGRWAEEHGTPRSAPGEHSYAHVSLGPWNLARSDDETRQALDAIRTEGLPFLEIFADRDRLRDAILAGAIPGLDPQAALEILGRYFDDDLARRYLDDWTTRNPTRRRRPVLFWA